VYPFLIAPPVVFNVYLIPAVCPVLPEGQSGMGTQNKLLVLNKSYKQPEGQSGMGTQNRLLVLNKSYRQPEGQSGMGTQDRLLVLNKR
jgi:hypothetical protein